MSRPKFIFLRETILLARLKTILNILALMAWTHSAYSQSTVSEKIIRNHNITIIPNLDDDDRDGVRDFQDDKVNGLNDFHDLAQIEFSLERAHKVAINTNQPVNVFIKTGDQTFEKLKTEQPDNQFTQKKILLFEATQFAQKDQPRRFQIKLFHIFEDGTQAISHVNIAISPFIMLPNSAPTETIYVASGAYDNRTFLKELIPILKSNNVAYHPIYTTYRWKEMWMQDTMEIGYAKLPGKEPVHVVLNGIRGTDSFGPTLLGPDLGVELVGSYRNLKGGDKWADWFGNLEVTPPLPGYPLGRVYFGVNGRTGVGMHPEIVAFIEAQEEQFPFSIDTSYLTIKHVDEILNFVSDREGNAYMLFSSTKLAEKLLGGSNNHDKNIELEKSNKRIQQFLDRIKLEILEEIPFEKEKILELPTYYNNGRSIWSNPVNSIFLNGTAVFGNSNLPDEIKKYITDTMTKIGLKSAFINDSVYHRRHGNVHCATNTKKAPLAEK